MKKREISRRQFLKRASGITAGAIAFPYLISSSALGRAGRPAPSNRIVMGCIGMGGQGTGNMRGFLGKREMQVVAICDVDKKHRDRAKKFVDERYKNNDCKAYVDFREVTGRKDIDSLSLALPDQWHSIPAIMGARSGKDIYAEKPFARTIREGRAMCDAGCGRQAASSGRRVTSTRPVSWSATGG